jgi:hypothetical protein
MARLQCKAFGASEKADLTIRSNSLPNLASTFRAIDPAFELPSDFPSLKTQQLALIVVS